MCLLSLGPASAMVSRKPAQHDGRIDYKLVKQNIANKGNYSQCTNLSDPIENWSMVTTIQGLHYMSPVAMQVFFTLWITQNSDSIWLGSLYYLGCQLPEKS